jgi:hypothetical protein
MIKKNRLKREQRIKTLVKEYSLNGLFVEIGVLRGAFSNHLLQCNPSKLYLVDSWLKYPTEIFNDYVDFTQKDFDIIYDKVCNKFANKNVEIIRNTSEGAVGLFTDNSLDLVYIDANHSYEYCYKDLCMWWGKVKKGGFISGHDYQHKGVTKAVSQFITENNLKITEITEEIGCASYFIQKI